MIVLLSLLIIVAGIIVIVCLHRRRTKSPLGMDQAGGSTVAESSSLETFDVPLPPPPAYGEDVLRRRRYHGTCPTSEYDDDYGCDSSGRGSAEKPPPPVVPCSADREIQMINSGAGGPPCPRGGLIAQPDSGIQPDHDDAGSTGSRRGKLAAATSVDSMHQAWVNYNCSSSSNNNNLLYYNR